MKILAAVDIGNSTTEVCIAEENESGKIRFLSGAAVFTTGLKGTVDNVTGILSALKEAAEKAGVGSFDMHGDTFPRSPDLSHKDNLHAYSPGLPHKDNLHFNNPVLPHKHRPVDSISHIRINEAAPVIGGAAMETLTQTVVTESSMLGHNPKTPAGYGTGVGKTIDINNLNHMQAGVSYIVVVPEQTGYETAAMLINQVGGANIAGAILQLDEAVLVYNRLNRKIPIIDEVRGIGKIKEGVETAIEVALPGQAVRLLSNPYGIATLLKLSPEETFHITPIAKSLAGAKSAVVMKTPWHNPAPPQKIGKITITGENPVCVDFNRGADAVMDAVEAAGAITNISGEPGTDIGNMLARVVESMADLASEAESDAKKATPGPAGHLLLKKGAKCTKPSSLEGGWAKCTKPPSLEGGVAEGVEGCIMDIPALTNVQIRDLFAVDTFAPVAISGALAGETSLEKAIAVAAMVTAGRLPMQEIAKAITEKTGIYTAVNGVEPVMAALGALTTPGTSLPLAVLDLGGGSIDAAIIDRAGTVKSVSVAGAGELVTMMIKSQLGLASRITAENIKKYPIAKVESMFNIRLETGEIIFYEEGINPRFFGAIVIMAPGGMIKIDEERPIEKIVGVRQDAKRGVFVKNATRAIKKILPTQDNIKHVILVGGSAEDFEIPGFISAAFADMGIVCGRGNIRGSEGARGAVATGLVMAYAGGS
ncbi:MAG: diol dehydratase reactivase subunit alpha [Defluviitaleaceae bacterium]|nr:diol dehydratase reactivase subunit alpha [Defluviitaleaceae bacterium]